MKHPQSRALSALLLLLAIATPPPSARAEDTASVGSMATTTMQGLTSALNTLNSGFTAYGASGTQLQALAAQLAGAQQQAQAQQTPQSQFDQIQKQLQAAMLEAQNCVSQVASTNYDKYYAKRSAKEKDIVKNLPTDALTGVEATCSTYGVILDAIELKKAQMDAANKKMACLVNMQSKVDQIAEAAKAPFQSLNSAAGEVYKTYSQIIDSHNKIAGKIADDVDGPADKDGKRSGGYRAALGDLKKTALELNNVLNARAGALKPEGGAQDQGLKYGLVKQVENLKQQRLNAGNKWYYTLMEDVEHCYHTEPTSCFDNDVNLPPDQCIGAAIQNEGVGSNSAGKKVRANTDAVGLQRVSLKNYMGAQKINLPSNIDVSDPNQVLAFTQTRFQDTLKGVLASYQNHKFSSSISNDKIVSYVNNAYRACYDKAVATFRSDMNSKGGRYFQDLQNTQDMERETANDIKNWIDRVEGRMSEFRTQFHKVYNSELSQFKSDCTGDEDPYKGLDCLRVLNAQLQSGISGTRVSTKMGGGATYTSMAGETQLPIQTLTLDAQGKPSIGSSNVTCSGFDDCINYLDRARDQHASAAQTSTDDRQKFVDQHNSAVKSSFAIVAAQFAPLTQLLASGAKGVNDDLTSLGIKAQVKTKQVEGEELKENEKTGLYDMPKSMKAALAGQNSYTQLEETKDVTDAFNSMRGDLNKKAGEAQKMKRLCKVDDGDYKALKVFPSCEDAAKACNRDRVAAVAGPMERLFRKSVEKVDENGASRSITASSDYKSCVSELKADANSSLQDDEKLEEYAQANNLGSIYSKTKDGTVTTNPQVRAKAVSGLRARNSQSVRQGTRQDCSDYILSALAGQAGNSRESLQRQNTDIVQALRGVNDACGELEYDDEGKISGGADEVTAKCEDYNRLVNAAKAPTGESETGAGLDGAKGSGTTGTDVFKDVKSAK